MGYHKDSVGMMKQPKQLQGTPLHMRCIWHLFVIEPTNICHHKILTIIIKSGKHNSQPYVVPINV
jgi:hypothetical protein